MDLAAYFASRDPSQDATAAMPIIVKGAVREDLARYLGQRGCRTGAEIGVYKGEFAERLCVNVPGVHLIGVDRWCPYINRQNGKRIFRSAIAAEHEAKARLAAYSCTFIKADSVEAAARVPDRSLDFVYLDADHWLPAVIADLNAWLPKVRPGGIIAGHDYEDRLAEDNRVAIAVKAWTEATGVRPWFVLGRAKVRPDEPHERHRTWMWVV